MSTENTHITALHPNNLVHGDNAPILFVVGKKGGLTKVEVEKETF